MVKRTVHGTYLAPTTVINNLINGVNPFVL